jgi:RNase adapter protein RapZ
MSERRVILLTGPAGAGRTQAVRTLDDLGYRCIDNLPVEYLDRMKSLAWEVNENLVIGVDVRREDEATKLASLKIEIAQHVDTKLIFLNAESDVLLSRFQTTRRKHPLLDDSGELRAAILRQKRLLDPIEREVADVVIDTTFLNPHDLAGELESLCREGDSLRRQLHVTMVSFGFKYGILREADLVFDVRFLKNPFFVADLKGRSGQNPQVRDFVLGLEESQVFLDKSMSLIDFLLPQYFMERKHYLRIGIGCTGGQHRSVAIAEELGSKLAHLKMANILVSVSHRDKSLPS